MGLFSAAVGLLPGAASAYGAHREAEMGRDWQEHMRATQYQTAVADMKAAGLNPMLAYSQGGAGNVSSPNAAPTDFSSQINSAAAAQRQRAETDYIKSQQQGVEKENTKKDYEIKVLKETYGDLEQTPYPTRGYVAGLPSTKPAWQEKLHMELEAAIAKAKAERHTPDVELAIKKLDETLKALQVPGSQAWADFYKNIGEYLPYLKTAAEAGGAVAAIARAITQMIKKPTNIQKIFPSYKITNHINSATKAAKP